MTATEAPAVAALPLLTVSSARAYRSCPRSYKHRYEDRMEPVGEKAAALRFGTLIHLGLEAWWKADAVARLDAAFAAVMPAPGEDRDPFEQVKIEELLRGYDARWSADADTMEVLGVESEFVAPLRNPESGAPSRTWALGGKLDVIVRLADGRVAIIEHKTSSDDITPGSNYWKRLVMDPQVSTYHVGARALGFDVALCLYDVIGKPSLKPRAIPVIDDGAKVVLDASGARVRTKDGKKWRETASAEDGYFLQTRPETPDEFRERVGADIAADPNAYFQRPEVLRLEEDERDAAFDVWQVGREIRDAQLAGRWPRNGDACIRFGSVCSFFDVCARTASIDDPNLYRKRDSAHAELSQPLAGAT